MGLSGLFRSCLLEGFRWFFRRLCRIVSSGFLGIRLASRFCISGIRFWIRRSKLGRIICQLRCWSWIHSTFRSCSSIGRLLAGDLFRNCIFLNRSQGRTILGFC